jgi:GNAT superfamily N-acetyltransferase
MRLEPDGEPVRTPRLDLVTVTAPFVAAVTAGESGIAEAEIGAPMDRWLMRDPSHLVQLRLAAEAAAAAGFAGFARVVVLLGPPRRAIGSIGFHGPPDDRGRLEIGCRIQPAYRGRGYAAEALTAMLEWATARYGVTRFLLAVPSRRTMPDLVPVEVEPRRSERPGSDIPGLAAMMEWD